MPRLLAQAAALAATLLVFVAAGGSHAAASAEKPAVTASPSAPGSDEQAPEKGKPNAPETKADAARPNGFDLSNAVVPRESIREGGPARDRIRSVDAPEFAPPPEAAWCPPPVPVIGMSLDGVAHAYPVHVLEYHQVVNDQLGDVPVVVAYDPLTGIPRGYRSTVDGRVLHFGVSGLLYHGQFLLYDRETESLWAQYEGRAVAGPMAGKRLVPVEVRQEQMGIWFQRHNDTTVLKLPEPDRIDYRQSPYELYWVSDSIPFEVDARDDRYHPKEVVVGVEVDGKTRAYLGSILTAEGGRIVDDFEGRRIRIAYDSESGTFLWEVPDDVKVTEGYWFAWKAFHPDTEIWHDRAGEVPPKAGDEEGK